MMKVGILLFNDVEVLDFAGPFEVFSVASRVAVRDGDAPAPPFEVFTVARASGPVRARHGLRILPDHTLERCPRLDILIVPGGVMTEPLGQPDIVDWVRRASGNTPLVASVCTGAFLLGKAGLLEGKRATTHWEDLEDLRALAPGTDVVGGTAYVDEGGIITSAGVASGIVMSLAIVARYLGEDVARRTARQIEFPCPDRL